MSEYDLRPGGSLKLKGSVIDGGIVKKKKKKSKRRDEGPKRKDEGPDELEQEQRVASGEERGGSTPGSGRNSPAVVGSSNGGTKKTEAERRFEEVQKKRLAERVAKLAGKTHKDRVNEFNTKLEALSEHHDIPKVGPG